MLWLHLDLNRSKDAGRRGDYLYGIIAGMLPWEALYRWRTAHWRAVNSVIAPAGNLLLIFKR